MTKFKYYKEYTDENRSEYSVFSIKSEEYIIDYDLLNSAISILYEKETIDSCLDNIVCKYSKIKSIKDKIKDEINHKIDFLKENDIYLESLYNKIDSNILAYKKYVFFDDNNYYIYIWKEYNEIFIMITKATNYGGYSEVHICKLCKKCINNIYKYLLQFIVPSLYQNKLDIKDILKILYIINKKIYDNKQRRVMI